MAIHWIHLGNSAGTGDGSSSGNAASAFASVTIADGDTVYVKGQSRGVPVTITQDGVTVRPWPDTPASQRPWLRGDIQITSGNWTDETDGTFSATLATKPNAVFWNIATNIDANGRHFGHLDESGSLASCQATEGTWYHQSGTLYVHPATADGAADPDNGDDYSYTVTGQNGLEMSGDNATCKGLRSSFWTTNASAQGYGFYMRGDNPTIEDLRADDCGYHGIGLVTAAKTKARAYRCSVWGAADTQWVIHTQTGELNDVKLYECSAHMYSRLGTDGQPLGEDEFEGFYTHGASGEDTVRDIELHRFRWIGYGGYNGSLASGDNIIRATDYDDPETYSVRCYDCEAVGVGKLTLGGAPDCEFAFIRSKLDFTDSLTGAEQPTDSAIRLHTGTSLGLFACSITSFADYTDTDTMLQMVGSCRVTIANSALFLNGTNVACSFFDSSVWNSIGRLNVYGTVFVAPTATGAELFKIHNGQLITALDGGTLIQFEGCWYDGITAFDGRALNNYDTPAEWQAGVDATGVYDEPAGFIRIGDRYELDPAGNASSRIREASDRPSVTITQGINKRNYDGRVGPLQGGESSDPVRITALLGLGSSILV